MLPRPRSRRPGRRAALANPPRVPECRLANRTQSRCTGRRHSPGPRTAPEPVRRWRRSRALRRSRHRTAPSRARRCGTGGARPSAETRSACRSPSDPLVDNGGAEVLAAPYTCSVRRLIFVTRVVDLDPGVVVPHLLNGVRIRARSASELKGDGSTRQRKGRQDDSDHEGHPHDDAGALHDGPCEAARCHDLHRHTHAG
eukprot:scaffold36795_cov63-Phaeocystis_antarctica.AAC.5